MADVSQGHGWWLAVDGKWYPPVAPAPTAAGPPVAERPDLFPLEVPELIFAEIGRVSFDWDADGFHIRGKRGKALHTFALTEDGWEQAWRLMLGSYPELADAVMTQAAMEFDEEDAEPWAESAAHIDFVGEWQIMLFTPEGEVELSVEGGPLDAADAARRAVEGASGGQATETEFGWQSPEGSYAAITRPTEPSGGREQASPPPSRVDSRPPKPSPAWALLVAGAVLTVGSLLPWATASVALRSVSVSGTSGDGVITLVAGLVTIFVGGAIVLDTIRPSWAWLAVAAGVVGLFVAGYDLHHLPHPKTALVRIQAGIGLWLCLIGALGSLLLAVATLTQDRRGSM